MEKQDYIIDIQAFLDKDVQFCPKEIAVIGVNCNFVSHWIIKPPYGTSELTKGILAANSCTTCLHHGIEWFDGESNLEDVYKALRELTRNAFRIYVRGVQKAELLSKVLSRQIYNLEDFKCPSYKSLYRVSDHFCTYHARKGEYYVCALAYAYKLRLWITKTLYASHHTEPVGEDVVDFHSDGGTEEATKLLKNKFRIDTPKKKKRHSSYIFRCNPKNAVVDGITDDHYYDKADCVSEGHFYHSVDDEQSPASESVATRTSADHRGFSSGSDTVCLGETVRDNSKCG